MMSYLQIELARTIDEDRFRVAERHRRINKPLSLHQKQPINPAQMLAHWLQSLGQRVATEQQTRALAELN